MRAAFLAWRIRQQWVVVHVTTCTLCWQLMSTLCGCRISGSQIRSCQRAARSSGFNVYQRRSFGPVQLLLPYMLEIAGHFADPVIWWQLPDVLKLQRPPAHGKGRVSFIRSSTAQSCTSPAYRSVIRFALQALFCLAEGTRPLLVSVMQSNASAACTSTHLPGRVGWQKLDDCGQCGCLLEALDHQRGDPAESQVAEDVCGRLRAELVFVSAVKLLHHPQPMSSTIAAAARLEHLLFSETVQHAGRVAFHISACACEARGEEEYLICKVCCGLVWRQAAGVRVEESGHQGQPALEGKVHHIQPEKVVLPLRQQYHKPAMNRSLGSM